MYTRSLETFSGQSVESVLHRLNYVIGSSSVLYVVFLLFHKLLQYEV